MRYDRFDRYLPRLIIFLMSRHRSQSLREIFPSVYQHFYFPHVSSALPRPPFRVCTRKHRANKLPRTYPGFSLSFRIPILSYLIFSHSLSLSLFLVHVDPSLPPRVEIPLDSRSFGPAQHQVNALVTNAPCSYASRPFITRTCDRPDASVCVILRLRVRA